MTPKNFSNFSRAQNIQGEGQAPFDTYRVGSCHQFPTKWRTPLPTTPNTTAEQHRNGFSLLGETEETEETEEASEEVQG